MIRDNYDIEANELVNDHLDDWVVMAQDIFGVFLDEEQKQVLRSVQFNKKTSVRSGTARGKDFIAAVAAMCFFYATPTWNKAGEMIENTKVFLTAPTDRQIGDIMYPEISKLHGKALSRGFNLPGRLIGYGIRTNVQEWFLTGFKASNDNHEAWTGLHAPNIMFVVTEASGIPKTVFDAIEGNLQGNSRLLIVFNDNTGSGYASETQKHPDWAKFTLDSLNAYNVLQKKDIIPGQVGWEWVDGRVHDWCIQIQEKDMSIIDGDFSWEGKFYRPNDLFRVKVRGLPPRVASDVLIPEEWYELAEKRWLAHQVTPVPVKKHLRLGADIAGMGRDSNKLCHRFDQYVAKFETINSNSPDIHMVMAGNIKAILEQHTDTFRGWAAQAMIDTIGEGAGVYSRLLEVKKAKDRWAVWSCKFSYAAVDPFDDKKVLTDITGQYTFLNLRAYLFWRIRDWLDPSRNTGAMLPPNPQCKQELTTIIWKFRSDGSIQIEEKEEIKKKLKRSPDDSDALANTFYPVPDISMIVGEKKNVAQFFH